jgi:hypothetical protein
MENPAPLGARSVRAVADHPGAAALALALLSVLAVVLAYKAIGNAGAAAKSAFASGGAPAGAPGGRRAAEAPGGAPEPAPAEKPRGPCRREWSPAAIAEAQGLATAGGLGFSGYGESQLANAANFESDADAGLTDEAMVSAARYGAAP